MIARYIPQPKPRRPANTRDKPLVRVTYIPDRVAYLLEAGPDQSEIRWKHNGNTLIVCNEFVEKITENRTTTTLNL